MGGAGVEGNGVDKRFALRLSRDKRTSQAVRRDLQLCPSPRALPAGRGSLGELRGEGQFWRLLLTRPTITSSLTRPRRRNTDQPIDSASCVESPTRPQRCTRSG